MSVKIMDTLVGVIHFVIQLPSSISYGDMEGVPK